jgi:integrase
MLPSRFHGIGLLLAYRPGVHVPKLTKRIVDAARPREADYLLFDDALPRFGLRVMPSGIKSYLVQYRKDGHTRRLTLGQHGPLTADQAREKALRVLADVTEGHDPSRDKQAHRRSPTVSEVCIRFLDEHAAHRCKASTQREYRRSVELFITPRLGQLKIVDVTRKDIAELHNQMRHVPYQANRTLGILSKLFNLTEVWGLRPDGSNPTRHVRKYTEVRRQRFLSGAEFSQLGETLRDVEREGLESPSAIAAIRLLLLTGCRLGEIMTLKWEHVHGDELRLPDSKTGAKVVHIGGAAMSVLEGLERLPDNSFVITGKKPGANLTDLQSPWQRIRKLAGLEDVRIHDLRHSFASGAIALGESLSMIAELLGHRTIQTTERYTHLAAHPVKAAAGRISDEIARAINGNSATTK